jgi:hypothetical protein
MFYPNIKLIKKKIYVIRQKTQVIYCSLRATSTLIWLDCFDGTSLDSSL